MSEMVERVAAAQYESAYRPDASRYERWELLPPTERAPWLEAARVAINAMREPTDAMIAAAMFEAATDLRSEYRAMIDAALAEP